MLVSRSIVVELCICRPIVVELESIDEIPGDTLTKSVSVSIVVVSNVESSVIDVGSINASTDDIVAADAVLSSETVLVVAKRLVLAAEDDGGLSIATEMLVSTVADNGLAVSGELLVIDIGASCVEVVASNDSIVVGCTTPTDVSSVMIASDVLVTVAGVLA
jgi:hypothetical protein